jgi:hypothetical protein
MTAEHSIGFLNKPVRFCDAFAEASLAFFNFARLLFTPFSASSLVGHIPQTSTI